MGVKTKRQEIMKEKLEPLENLAKNIKAIAADCTELIDKNSEDGKVVFQSLTKLDISVHSIYLETLKKQL